MLVIYIQGNNGARAEGRFTGLLNEITFFNVIPEDFNEALRRMDELGSAPDVKNKSLKIVADVEIPQRGADGVTHRT